VDVRQVLVAMRTDCRSYVPAFDGIRGIAILPVMCLHVGAVSLPNGNLLFQLSRGWYGVDLFFVLSGFLITWILDAEIAATGTINLKHFYRRRASRLAPAYISTLSVLLIGTAILERSELSAVPRVVPWLLTYTYNYEVAVGRPHFTILVVLWSLCVEEQFYLAWPWILRRLGRRQALWFCVCAILVLTVYRTVLFAVLNGGDFSHVTGASASRIYFGTDTRVGVILTGCALALSINDPSTRRWWDRIEKSYAFPMLALIADCICVAFITGGSPSSASWRSATVGYTLAAFTTAMVIAAVFAQPRSIVARMLSWRPLVELGRISYGTYLFHLGIAWTVLHCLRRELWSSVASRMSDPALGVALPVSQATVVPLSGALSRVAASIEPDPFLLFAVALPLVLASTLAVAALHYQYVELRFTKRRDPVALKI
jgi:peptidoglycan/LPS O-acetylase OafA/YrhL